MGIEKGDMLVSRVVDTVSQYGSDKKLWLGTYYFGIGRDRLLSVGKSPAYRDGKDECGQTK